MDISILTYGIPFLMSLDIFFLSISGGVTFQPYKSLGSFKISLAFVLSQAVFATAGLYLGTYMQSLFTNLSLLVATSLIGFFAFKMIQEAIKVKNEQRTFLIEDNDIILPLALASSLNTFVFFVGLGFLKIPYIESIIVLSVAVVIISQIGLFIGSHYRPQRIGRSSKLAAGISIIILILLFYFL